jgi:hypothetical protein
MRVTDPAQKHDRILKGEKLADLPVQAPSKYRVGDQPQNPRCNLLRCMSPEVALRDVSCDAQIQSLMEA